MQTRKRTKNEPEESPPQKRPKQAAASARPTRNLTKRKTISNDSANEALRQEKPVPNDEAENLSVSSSLSDPPSTISSPTPLDLPTIEPVVKAVARRQRVPAKRTVKKVSAKEHEEALNLFIRESSDEESDTSSEKNGVKGALEGHEHSDEDDDVWEEVDLSHRKEFSFDDLNGDEEVQDLEVTLDRTQQSMRLKYLHIMYCLIIRNKSASAAEKKIRMHTHLLHVQCLLVHGSIRNAWLEDEELQVESSEILI
jgi:hypothetical protein